MIIGDWDITTIRKESNSDPTNPDPKRRNFDMIFFNFYYTPKKITIPRSVIIFKPYEPDFLTARLTELSNEMKLKLIDPYVNL